MKISKNKIEEMIQEELYKILKELNIPELTPQSFSDTIKQATEPDTEVTSPATLKQKWQTYSKSPAPQISNREAEIFSDLEDQVLQAAELEAIETGNIKNKIDQVTNTIDQELETSPESEEETYEL